LYVRQDLIPRFAPRITGWFGHEKPFTFTMPEQRYAANVWRYIGGTPAVAALYQARAGAEIVAEIGVEMIRRKHYCDHRPGAGIRISAHFYTLDAEIDAFFAEVDRLRGQA